MKKYFLFVVFSALVCCGNSANNEIKDILKEENSVIIDVRTSKEFSEGNIDKSINIPLDIIGDSSYIEELKRFNKIVVVCRSGGRSAKAKKILEENGFTNIYDGKGWESLKSTLEK